MNNNEYELSNVSFTNKDFFDIYPELLQLAKRLSDKWDPTVSNESDPGVVLIKELALIADKINYTSDKYALENNPRSVTQIENARQLYSLLGYYPEWYQSAIVELSMYWDGEREDNYVTIPKYTALTDNENEFIYTTLQDISLPLSGSHASGTITAIEGTLNKLIVNNSDIITLSMLSDDQKLFIENYNVATNGIIVTDSTEVIPWNQVNNINFVDSSDPTEKRSFSFGVDIVTGQCYLQFPRNISALIGDGLRIYYITSKGKDGNIPVNYLSKFVSTEIRTTDSDGNDVTLTTSDIVVTNSSNTFRGKDPVSIDEMYQNWKHIAGTFDTLVTLRDYNNAIRRLPDLASNGFVCDRTNDVQLSYKVMKGSPEMPTTKIKVEKYEPLEDGKVRDWDRDGVSDDKITPYDLKLYCLQAFPYDELSDYSNYNSTFQIFSDYDDEKFDELWKDSYNFVESNDRTKKLVEALLTYYCISHNYKVPEPEKICMLKNKYTVKMQILANQDLTPIQAREMKSNICKAIYTTYQAKNIEFGETIDYDEFLQVIQNADSRVKTVILDKLSYDTYAVCYRYRGGVAGTGMEWFEVPVSDEAYKRFIETEGDSEFLQYKRGSEKHYYTGAEEPYYRQQAMVFAKNFRLEILAKNILAGITPYLIDIGGKHPYKFDNRFELNTPASHVKTDVYIPMVFGTIDEQTKSRYTITLGKNEVIEFSRPNLLDLREYGSFIYYQYESKNKAPLARNQSHTLSSTEKICFFYKEADSDQMYRFDLYGEGTVIKPTFDLKPNIEDGHNMISTVFGSAVPKKGDYIFNYYPLTETKAFSSLSVSDSIMIQRVNQVRLPKTGDAVGYIYFVTNTVKDNQYVLDLSSGRYILQENEFFIHTNVSKTSLEIVGQGAEIKWVGSSTSSKDRKFYADTVLSSDIALFGAQALKGKWLTLSNSNAVSVVEKAFSRATEGSVVEFTYGTTLPGQTVTVELDSEGLHSGEYWKQKDLYYTGSDGTTDKNCSLQKAAEDDTSAPEDTKTIVGNMKYFLGIDGIYKYNFNNATEENGEAVHFDLIQIRQSTDSSYEQAEYNRDLYAWECECKDGVKRYIYDYATFKKLFGTDPTKWAEEIGKYRTLLGLGESDNTASAPDLVSISDPNPSSGASGSSGSGSGSGESSVQYEPTEKELDVFKSWYVLYSQSYGYFKHMSQFIKYPGDEDISDKGSMLDLVFEYNPESSTTKVSMFESIKIDGQEEPLTSTEGIVTECKAFLILDVGPDNPQTLRADTDKMFDSDGNLTGADNVAIDRVWFYLNGTKDSNIVGSLNNVLTEAKQYVLYADVNVYAQSTGSPVNVQYKNQYLEDENPIFYSFIEVASHSVDGELRFTKMGKVSFINFGKAAEESLKSIFKTKQKLPAGKYLFRLTHSNESLETLKLAFKIGSDIRYIKPMNSDDANISEPGTYYMMFEVDDEELDLKVTYKLEHSDPVQLSTIQASDYKYGEVFKLSEDVSAEDKEGLDADIVAGQYIVAKRDKAEQFSWWDWSEGQDFPMLSLEMSELTLYDLGFGYVDQNEKQDYYGYVDQGLSGTYKITEQDLLDKIQELDYDSEFNYLYEIPEKKLIKNPLLSSSFFNLNHVYNRFTIAQSKKPEILV